jgi:ribosome biogenesis GTPase
VRFIYNPQGESRITEVLPRWSQIARLDPSSSGLRAQILAVNFDTLFFAMAVNGNASAARLERLVALAEKSGCRDRAVVLLTKCDLTDGAAPLPDFSGFGLPVLAISSRTGEGLAAVRRYVQPRRTVALIGSSGVGKSTLVNALAGDAWMATGEIQSWSGKGRHTTTSRELVMLPCGAMALDTPGLRELGILGTDGFELKGRTGGTHRYRVKSF